MDHQRALLTIMKAWNEGLIDGDDMYQGVMNLASCTITEGVCEHARQANIARDTFWRETGERLVKLSVAVKDWEDAQDHFSVLMADNDADHGELGQAVVDLRYAESALVTALHKYGKQP